MTVAKKLAELIQHYLRDENQGFLAIIAFGMALQDILFGAPGEVRTLSLAIQYLVVFCFALEYCASLSMSQKRTAFMLSPRRILDLAIILLCIGSLFPTISDKLVHVAAFKILRLAPIFFFGYRSTRELLQADPTIQVVHGSSEIGFHRLAEKPDGEIEFIDISNLDFQAWLKDPNRSGCYCAGSEDTTTMAQCLSVPDMPASFVQSALEKSSYPRVLRLGKTLFFAGSIPAAGNADEGTISIESAPFLVVCTDQSFLGISTSHRLAVTHEVVTSFAQSPFEPTDDSLPERLFFGMFKTLLEKYDELASRLEIHLRRWEMTPLGRPNDADYLAVYRLQQALSRLKSDLWRLGHLLDKLEHQKLRLPFEKGHHEDTIAALSDSCDYLAETFSRLHETASSGLDIRMNLISFQMNRFMGLLAVATAAGLIPATIGGFLGMNILGTNFPVTLANVSFWAALLIVLVLYFMKTRGWLRF